MKAVVMVDVQNDFLKGGALPYGYPDVDIVPSIAEFVKERHDAGDVVFATLDTHYDDYLDTLEGKRLPVKHCLHGSPGHAIDSRVDPEAVDRRISKSTFGAAGLAQALYVESFPDGLDEIVMCGGCTSICLVANAVLLRAKHPDTPISVRADLCFDIDEASHNAALAVLRNQMIDVKYKGDK